MQANARVSLGGTFAGLAVGALGAAIVAGTDPKWGLRLAALVFAAGTIFALQLPTHADSSEGEQSLRSTVIVQRPAAEPGRRSTPDERTEQARAWWADDDQHPPPAAQPSSRLRIGDLFAANRIGLGPAVLAALRANSALRYYTGFLTIFLAFLVRTHDFGPPANISLGLFGVAALGAGVVGTLIGAVTRGRAPNSLLVLGLAGVTALTYVAGLLFSLFAVILVAMGAAMAQTLGKLALDASIQRDVAEEVRTAAFARTETVLQLSFVVGGAFGLIPFNGRVGLLGAAIFLTVVLMDAIHRRARLRRGRA
jgi:MFS family permease